MASQPSFEGDLLNFEPEDNPPWRRKGQVVPSVGVMVTDIVGFQEKWNSMKKNRDACAVQPRQFIENLLHCNREHSCMASASLGKTRECLAAGREVNNPTLSSEKRRENAYLEEAYNNLRRGIEAWQRNNYNRWLIEEPMLKRANETILKSATTRPGCTEPGEYSTRPRYIEFDGELYEYQNPDNMQIAVVRILEKFNSLFQETNNPETQNDEHEDKAQRLRKLYNACGWLVFEMLDLHPFGDGNGRLCRLLCSCVLSTCTPFPTPIYDIWSTSCKYDYMKALVEARKSDTRHPRALVTMIIECSWYGWKEFLERLQTTT
ncbi:uncharacterized protein LOC119735192 [Patiria miniata]|uniref:Fido domain-containing protein n=1 Tax=Patiria miniata TaxID=46514 RepID=A0A914AMU1_PATMI|nr:uncharacterized protein LOC119735192 [Patiria miniata]